MKDSEIKVTLAIARKTFGWQKSKDKISLSQLIEMTGMSSQGVRNGIDEGIKRGTITRAPDGQSFIYSLTMQPSSAVLCNEVAQSEQKPCYEVATQKKEFKETIKDISPDKPVSEPINVPCNGDGEELPIKRKKDRTIPVIKNPFIQAYKSIMHITPNQVQQNEIITRVKNFPLWGETLEHWAFHGWSPKNVPAIIEFYEKGGKKACTASACTHIKPEYKRPVKEEEVTLWTPAQ